MKKLIYLLVLPVILSACKKKEIGGKASDILAIESFYPLSGKGSTEVTITGQKFSTNRDFNLITIGGFGTTPVSASSTQLVFNVPAGIPIGSYTISVKVNGITVTSAQKFEVTETSGDSGIINTSKIPVDKNIINKSFVDWGKATVHPRLLFYDSDIARIKSMVLTDNFAKPTYDNIIIQANSILTKPILQYGLDGAGLRIENIHEFSNNQVPYLVLAYQFTKDTKYALRCWQQFEAMTTWPDWGGSRHFLDAGIVAKAAAMAYDGLYDYLTIEQRAKLVTAVRNFIFKPYLDLRDKGIGPFKWQLSNDNWNGICHGGIIMSALAMYETDPAYMSDIIASCANGMQKYIQSFDPDGASEEGMSYWSYGLSNTFLALESMKRVLSTDYGLSNNDGFKKTGWFPYYMSGPVSTSSIGDDYLYNGVSNKFLSYFWFAKNFNDADFAKAHYDACIKRNAANSNKMNGWSDLLFYDPALVNAGSLTNISLVGYLKGIDYMYIRENNTDQNSLYVGMHGGSNTASHGHLDAGSFYIQAVGETFAQGNLGVENPYPSDYFTVTSPSYNASPTTSASSPGRFYYYRVRTEGKNCLIFNPDARPEQNPDGAAVLDKQGADNSGGYYILNMLGCYSRDVTAYKRGIKLNRSTGVITVQDEFTPKVSSTVYWLMHSPATDGLMISSDGKTATMVKNGKTFYAVIKSPSNATFVKVDRSTSAINYLPETAPIFATIMSGKNSLNPYYGKLQIKLTSVSGATKLRVDFVKNSSTVTPALTDLASWTTTN